MRASIHRYGYLLIDASNPSPTTNPTEDRCVYMDGFKINRFSDLSGYLSSKRPGDKVEVNYVREGKLKTAIVILKKSSN